MNFLDAIASEQENPSLLTFRLEVGHRESNEFSPFQISMQPKMLTLLRTKPMHLDSVLDLQAVFVQVANTSLNLFSGKPAEANYTY